MSRKNKESVKQAIQELAMGNYRSYPQEYGAADAATESAVQSLAKGYWDCRDIREIERDEKLGINLEDYEQWTHEAYEAFNKEHAHSLN